MKRRIITIIFLFILIIMGLGVTFSAFSSENTLLVNQEIAAFIFEAKQTDQISLSLGNLKPGDNSNYKFSVSNSKEVEDGIDVSGVKISYQITLKTYHFIPLDIKLYKGESEEPLLVCDETYSRNDSKEIVCTSSIQEMDYANGVTDEYNLNVNFDSKYGLEYSDLVDFIDIEIKSWQKVGDNNDIE